MVKKYTLKRGIVFQTVQKKYTKVKDIDIDMDRERERHRDRDRQRQRWRIRQSGKIWKIWVDNIWGFLHYSCTFL